MLSLRALHNMGKIGVIGEGFGNDTNAPCWVIQQVRTYLVSEKLLDLATITLWFVVQSQTNQAQKIRLANYRQTVQLVIF